MMELTFDRACTQTFAVAAAKDCVHGTFYPTSLEPSHPGEMRVRKIARVAKSRV
jgi:hypothetical protein